MNILHVIQRYYPYVGGSELYFQEISERLAREGHAVALYTTDAWDLEHFWTSGKKTIDTRAETHNGVAVRRFPVRRLPFAPLAYPVLRRAMAEISALPFDLTALLFYFSRFTPWVPELEHALVESAEPFDLVHAANIPLDSIIYAAMRAAKKRGIPFVVTPFTHLGEPGDTRIRKYYTMRHQIAMLKRADAVIVQTDLEREALAARGVPEARMHKIGVGVNPREVLGGDGARFRATRGIENPIVFSLGTAAYDKGTIHLIEAMKKLWARGCTADLVLAGPTMTHFTNFIRAQPREVQNRVHLLGFVPDAEKKDLLAAGDVFALPSRTDSFGIVYLEAWLYNKPVVGAHAGGVPEVIADGRDGFLVKFGDTDALAARIEQLLADRALAESFGRAGHAKVLASLTWDAVYARVRGVYGELVNK